MTLPNLLTQAALDYTDQPALVTAQGILSFAQLRQRVSQWGAVLAERSLAPNSRLLLDCPNTADSLCLIWAAMEQKILVMPFNPALGNRQWDSANDRFTPEYLISDRAGYNTPSLTELSQLAAHKKPATAELKWPEPDSPVTGIFTSGSTGVPKLALLSYTNHYYNALGSQQSMALQPGDRVLLSLPLFHVGGLAMVFRILMSGATLVLGAELAGRVEDPEFLQQQGITHASMVATQLQRLVTRLDGRPLSLNALIGGGPVPEPLLQRVQSLGIHTWLTYGLTEMGSQVLTCDPKGQGSILPFRELELSAEAEVLVKGECLFRGYLTEAGILQPLDQQGWFHTGDLGQWQGDAFRIIGRKDNRFICAGENIQPEMIEQCLKLHPEVEEAVIIPKSDAEYGARPVAFVRVVNNALSTSLKQELADLIRVEWSSLLVPVAWYSLPPANGLKVNRTQLEAQVADEYLES